MTYLDEGLHVSASLTLKVESHLICVVDTRILAVFVMEYELIFPLKY